MCVFLLRVSEYVNVYVHVYLWYRRNHPGDKDKALSVMEELLKQQENQVPDFLCLCGRIYKDKFVESDYSDYECRDKAIYW